MMSMPIHTILRYKRKRQRQRKTKREREREVLENNTRSKSAKTGQPAETHLQPTRRKSRQPEKKETPTILEKSSACQRKRHQGRQHDNSGISKQIEHAHNLNEHWKFCVKIYMQLSVSTIVQGCAKRFIGHRAVAGDSSLTEKIKCVMPPAAEPSCKRTSVMISACGSLQWLFSKVRLEYLGCRYKVVADRSHSNRCTSLVCKQLLIMDTS